MAAASRTPPPGCALKAAAIALQGSRLRTARSRRPPTTPPRARTSTTIVAGDRASSRRCSRTTPSTSRRRVADFDALGRRRLRRARLPRLARGVPAAAAPGRRHPSSRRLPDVHAERLARPARRGAARRGDLAGVHRAARDASTRTSSSCRCGSSTSRPATTRTRPCCSPRRSRCARSRPFTWGAIFQDREAARYRRVVRAASEITKLELPADAARMLDDQALTEKTFVMWDIIHDRTHMRGDLPFDPFMIKQRMPFFLYSLEELRCDLTAFRECVAITEAPAARAESGATLDAAEAEMLEHAVLVQYAVIFDRIFRFAITGVAGAQLRRGSAASCCSRGCTSAACCTGPTRRSRSTGTSVPAAVVALGDAIDELYWRSIDRPEGRALARRVRARARHAHAATPPRPGRAACPTRSSPARRRATPTPCWTTSSRCRCSSRRSRRRCARDRVDGGHPARHRWLSRSRRSRSGAASCR